MILNFLKKFFGTVNERRVKSYFKIVEKINALEQNYSNLSDLELKEQTKVLKQKLADGKTLDDILPEAFATIREGAKRTLKQRHFDVQLVGGITLHNNQIAEMKTGEGKTLVSTLAVYLNALSGKGVHVVTVNDYLAKRDSEWMGQIYKFLGLSVGCILSNMADSERKEAYSCDITYGTNNEFGFDYLRDNMKFNLDEKVQRPFFFAIVDEVDSVLIDEARTPLVISGPAESNIDLYKIIDSLMVNIAPQDFQIDEKIKSINLTEQGIEKLETLLFNHQLIEEASNLFDVENVNVLHHIMQALRAHKIYRKDVDYMVRGGRVLIIDEFTGRALDGRRFSEGLHQAIEAKEQVEIHNESQTIASITFQNYFRLYPKLAGMAGTAMTEAAEFKDIYNLDVVSIPTNNPIKRSDENDEIYRTSEEKYHAIIEEIIAANKRKQPVLVGTISIEKSEHISDLLSKKSIEHQVLNAKHHENEAFIIAQAGKPSAVTIATNMAGRGTDIILGGNPEMLIKQSYLSNEKVDEDNIKTQAEKDKQIAIEAGGLYVIGTERHESRRIDDQLRGRSGRMGDPGKSKFFLSLEDDLMRIFASERISSILKTLGLKENEAIVHPLISRAIARAQARVEGHNYEIRKNLLRFDDVMNDQRKVIYEQRNEIMSNQDLDENVKEITHDVNSEIVNSNIPLRTFKEEWNLDNLSDKISEVYFTDFNVKEFIEKEDAPDNHKLIDFLNHNVAKLLSEKQQELGENIFSNAQQKILLFTIDHLWKEHLFAMDHLRHGIHLRAYGQKDPLNEYKKEAFELFTHMLSNLKELYIKRICNMRIDNSKEELPKEPSRNGTCPCGSNKKFKHCHGRLES